MPFHPKGRIFTPQPVNLDWSGNEGLVAWWLGLPELSGGPYLYDLLQRNKGTLTNGPTWGVGYGGFAAVDFDGSGGSPNDAVVCSTIPINGQTQLTIQAAIRLRSTQSTSPNIRQVIGAEELGGGQVFIRVGDSGTPDVFQFAVTSGSEVKAISGNLATANIGKDILLTGVYNAGSVTLYLNGESVGTNSGGSSITGSDRVWVIGDWYSGGRGFDGLIHWGTLHLGIAMTQSQVVAWNDQRLRNFPDALNRVRGSWFVLSQGTANDYATTWRLLENNQPGTIWKLSP